MSQFEEIPSPGRGFQGSRALGGLAACKTLASKRQQIQRLASNDWSGARSVAAGSLNLRAHTCAVAHSLHCCHSLGAGAAAFEG